MSCTLWKKSGSNCRDGGALIPPTEVPPKLIDLTSKPTEDCRREVCGYAHADYAASLSEFGTPRFLPNSGSWILERRIPGSAYSDAMGCYPLFVCQNWSNLREDLDTIGKDLVSLSLVTDPFGDYDAGYLRICFPDVAVIFKQHFVTDLSRRQESFVNSHHRRNARRALREMSVEKCANPEEFLSDWITLYSTLITRHDITGMLAFSPESFARQLRVPGMVAFRAIQDSQTIGMLLWYQQDDRAYYHLGAYSPTGYELRASFALFSYSIEYFAEQGIEWLSLGAGAGSDSAADSGLSRFKQGWSTNTRPVYFCGRILDRDRYQEIIKAQNVAATSYFPAYRRGEFS